MKQFLRVGVVLLWVAGASSASAQTVEFDALTIADINVAFDSGKLTSEQLVQLCLARIKAYDRQGPSLRAVIALNPKALDTARALDVERKAKGRRSPMHGIPVVLKDNYDTSDLPTTGGSVLLEGSIPPDDAFVVKKVAGRGRHHPGQGEHVGVRLGGGDELDHRAVAQSARPHAFAVRDRPAAPACRSPRPTRRSASAPTPADRFAGRPRRMAWRPSSPRTGC